ncbi:MAG: hypothetical protein J6A37_11450 [Oscillospiraceae bacterium]|nr:hypothetical protein [Oscillospiraceae bacterium]
MKYAAILVISLLIFNLNERFVVIPLEEYGSKFMSQMWRTIGFYMLLSSLTYVYEAMSLISGQQVDMYLYRR